jgi:16S rRNA (guanine966-N2)-methyltransferase
LSQRSAANQVRIVGGALRSRLISFPAVAGLRPSPDRVRETLFNWLGQRLDGKQCLDLFAGSGALGFEAISRGAARVVMVEQQRAAVRALEDNAKRLECAGLTIVAANALQYLAATQNRFDVVFIDPPFRQGLVPAVLDKLPPRLNEGALVYVESELTLDVDAGWEIVKQSRAGDVKFQLLITKI